MKNTWFKIALSLGFIAGSAALNSAYAESLVGITTQNQIGVFDSANVAAASFIDITGLSQGESLIGIDLRPSNNTLYAISSASKLYTVDAYTGATTLVAALSVAATETTPAMAYAINRDAGYGFDFNPMADRGTGASLRVVSSEGDNLAINVNAGASAGVVGNVANKIVTNPDTDFTAVAYKNSDPSIVATETALYYLDSKADTLSMAPTAFNTPTISLIGAIGFDILKANGFELFGNGNAFAAVNIDNGTADSLLLGINLGTGAGTLLGTFNGTLNGLTAAPSAVPVPAALPLLGSAIAMFGLSRRATKKAA